MMRYSIKRFSVVQQTLLIKFIALIPCLVRHLVQKLVSYAQPPFYISSIFCSSPIFTIQLRLL